MNISIVSVGKIKEKYFKDAISEYEKRLKPYVKLKIIEVNDEKAPENLSEKELEIVKDREADRILKKIKENSYIISLEIEGKSLSSESFSKLIKEQMTYGMGCDLVCCNWWVKRTFKKNKPKGWLQIIIFKNDLPP